MGNRNLVKIFKLKLTELGIRQSAIAKEAGKPTSHLSKLLTGAKSPHVQTLMDFIDAAERLYPGFADQYWLAVSGRPSILTFVESMDSSELAVLLQVVSQRIAHTQLCSAAKSVALSEK